MGRYMCIVYSICALCIVYVYLVCVLCTCIVCVRGCYSVYPYILLYCVYICIFRERERKGERSACKERSVCIVCSVVWLLCCVQFLW